MPVVESRIRNGTLVFTLSGTKAWSCQVLDVRCTPSFSKGDSVETLCGDLTVPATETTWVLKGKIVSDFAGESTASIVRWCLDNADEQATFVFLPNDSSGTDTIGGTVTVLPLELGGEVNSRIEVPFEFDMTAAPVYTPVA